MVLHTWNIKTQELMQSIEFKISLCHTTSSRQPAVDTRVSVLTLCVWLSLIENSKDKAINSKTCSLKRSIKLTSFCSGKLKNRQDIKYTIPEAKVMTIHYWTSICHTQKYLLYIFIYMTAIKEIEVINLRESKWGRAWEGLGGNGREKTFIFCFQRINMLIKCSIKRILCC